VKENIRRQLAAEAWKIEARLAKAEGGQAPRRDGPEFSVDTVHYEMAKRNHAITCGGIGAIHRLANKIGLVAALNTRLQILRRWRPYSEADHILNIAYNVMCGGYVLDDIELRRNDVAFLDALGTRSIPDPTTAGDFCRRFQPDHTQLLMDIINDVRVQIWKQQAPAFFEDAARIDADGTLVATTGECKKRAWTCRTTASGGTIRWSSRWRTQVSRSSSSIAREIVSPARVPQSAERQLDLPSGDNYIAPSGAA